MNEIDDIVVEEIADELGATRLAMLISCTTWT